MNALRLLTFFRERFQTLFPARVAGLLPLEAETLRAVDWMGQRSACANRLRPVLSLRVQHEVSPVVLWALLDRLESDRGFLASVPGESLRLAGREVKFYALTAAGRDALRALDAASASAVWSEGKATV